MNIDQRFFKAEFNINSAISRRLRYLENVLSKVRNVYAKMPEGNLLVAPGTRDTNFRYYLREKSSDRMGIYLNAGQEKTKKKYAEKKYYKELIKHVEKEIEFLKEIENKYPEDSIVSTYKNMGPAITRLIEPLNIDNETFINTWKNDHYEGLGFDKNDTSSFYSERKERMRSKSELLIANALNARNIPYKYECPISLANGQILYPDFTILDVKNRKVKYWEHLGRMGDMTYVSKNIWKLDEYKKMNIRMGINLFVTYENGINAIGTDDILCTIEAIMSEYNG